ncbi:small multi-drug resistant family protein [archaeon CG10_big_fil_rev_8_21_14_0_10_43_11]|nr:MAG: small multi-drug resistant family protein [archaeon CG10_big_fil_rev_8_21_14_0_10_43_11]
MDSRVLVVVLVVISVTLGSIGQFFMKYGMNQYGLVSLSLQELPRIILMLFQPFVFTGLALYGFSSILWLIVLSQADLSFVYPMLGLGFIFTALIGRFAFNESFTWVKFIGLSVIVLGVTLIGIGTPSKTIS